MPRGEDLFHTGIVVDDLGRALDELIARTGHRFADPMTWSLQLRTPDGEQTVDLCATYSRGPGPLIEVIEAVPGTHWRAVSGSGLHHLGYWVDDIGGESAALTKAGVPLEAAGVGPDGQVLYAYHFNADGIRIELVDRMMKPFIDQWTSPE